MMQLIVHFSSFADNNDSNDNNNTDNTSLEVEGAPIGEPLVPEPLGVPIGEPAGMVQGLVPEPLGVPIGEPAGMAQGQEAILIPEPLGVPIGEPVGMVDAPSPFTSLSNEWFCIQNLFRRDDLLFIQILGRPEHGYMLNERDELNYWRKGTR